MGAHPITTKPDVGGRGRAARTIASSGIVALSLAVVLLAASASSTAALPGDRARTTPRGWLDIAVPVSA